MSVFNAKMHSISTGLCPRLDWGVHSAPTDH